MKNQLPYVLFALLLMTGCRANQLIAEYQRAEQASLAIDLRVSDLTIVDARPDTTSQALKLPFMSLPGQQRVRSPTLTADHRNLLIGQVRGNFTGEGPPVDVRLILQEAYQEFSANAWSERERGYARLTIELYPPGSEQKQVWCSSNGEFFIQSADATAKRTEAIYQVALQRAVNLCLEHVKETMKAPGTY